MFSPGEVAPSGLQRAGLSLAVAVSMASRGGGLSYEGLAAPFYHGPGTAHLVGRQRCSSVHQKPQHLTFVAS